MNSGHLGREPTFSIEPVRNIKPTRWTDAPLLRSCLDGFSATVEGQSIWPDAGDGFRPKSPILAAQKGTIGTLHVPVLFRAIRCRRGRFNRLSCGRVILAQLQSQTWAGVSRQFASPFLLSGIGRTLYVRR